MKRYFDCLGFLLLLCSSALSVSAATTSSDCKTGMDKRITDAGCGLKSSETGDKKKCCDAVRNCNDAGLRCGTNPSQDTMQWRCLSCYTTSPDCKYDIPDPEPGFKKKCVEVTQTAVEIIKSEIQ